MNRLIVLFAVIMCGTLNMRAQFKVVDADDCLCQVPLCSIPAISCWA